MSGTTNGRWHNPTVPTVKEAAITLPCETQRPVVTDNTLAVVVYVLYGLGFWRGLFTRLKTGHSRPAIPVVLETIQA